jgi:hypothetical protein
MRHCSNHRRHITVQQTRDSKQVVRLVRFSNRYVWLLSLGIFLQSSPCVSYRRDTTILTSPVVHGVVGEGVARIWILPELHMVLHVFGTSPQGIGCHLIADAGIQRDIMARMDNNLQERSVQWPLDRPWLPGSHPTSAPPSTSNACCLMRSIALLRFLYRSPCRRLDVFPLHSMRSIEGKFHF